VSRRAEIAMSAAEIAAFLAEERVLVVATQGRDGWPHVMPLWYVLRDGVPWATTYDELRGVMVKAQVEIDRDVAVVEQVEREVFARYHGREPDEAEAASIGRQASKRVALAFVPRETASWDHRKL
jgi:hypothetical protein